ncbi:type VI secretion system-associated FHA domain protein TagH [Ectothiorhodospiraceae bacterium WFHF3C12]|nr:type VI secretion system-associated FHA domain protein TagH [Ectothiorhodospiraceae bacterium WFHF3C12]
MRLSLTVIGPQADSLGDAATMTWVDSGGTIGRAENNDWSLPDPTQEISRCHARVRFVGGAFYLEDTSANGIFLGDRQNRLSGRELLPLEDGQRLLIGGYEIGVAISDQEEAAGGVTPPGEPGPVEWEGDEDAVADPLDLLGGPVEKETEPEPLPQSDAPAYLEEHFDPAPVREDRGATGGDEDDAGSEGPVIPPDWWRNDEAPSSGGTSGPVEPPPQYEASPAPTPDTRQQIPGDADAAGSRSPAPPGQEGTGADGTTTPEAPAAAESEPPVRPRPARSARSAPEEPPARAGSPGGTEGLSDDALASLLRGAGVDPAELPPETAEALGRLLRVSVEGLMDLLRARMEVKNEFRMSVTLIQSKDNNPLKFSTGPEDALHNLLVKRNPDYLEPEEAFHAAFDDLRFHQMALLAGMRQAFFAMIERFDPDNLEELFNSRQDDRPVIGRVTRRRNWDQYRDLFQEIRQDTEGYFNRLFGEAFVTAYERQMEELAAGSRRRGGSR